MHYVITGAGQIGTQLASDLTSCGHQVTIIRRSAKTCEGTHLIQGDVATPGLVEQAVQGRHAGNEEAAAIFHCMHSTYSAKAWRRDLAIREQMVMDVAAQHDIPVVFPESVYAFGRGAIELHEGSALNPDSPLGEVRADLLDRRAAHSACTLSVVAADLLGPTASEASSVLLKMVLKPAHEGRQPWVLGSPDAPRSATYIPDLTQAMITASKQTAALASDGDAVLLSPSPEPISQRKLAALTAGATGQAAPAIHQIPWPILRLAGTVSAPLKEVRRQRYLWDAPAVITPGRLTTDFGLGATSWHDIIAKYVGAITA